MCGWFVDADNAKSITPALLHPTLLIGLQRLFNKDAHACFYSLDTACCVDLKILAHYVKHSSVFSFN